MSVIFLLIPLSIVTAAIFLTGFVWAVRSGQYEDTCTPAMRLLAEDQESAARQDKFCETNGKPSEANHSDLSETRTDE